MRNFDFMKRSLGMVVLFLMMSVQGAWAQAVKGTVNDEAGEPIIGASVKVVGSNTGAATDFNGNFSVNAPSNGQLEISYVGYQTQKVKINGQQNITVTLKEDAQMLNDVVVVGYGTMKKSDISGSVATIDQEAVMKRIPQNISQALQGSAAGVQVSMQDGSPEGKAAIRIRGIGTINGDASPLYVVDGVQVGTSADFVNPTDIERIEILKDASATAIYGSAGANGVVMITTKHGAKGKTNISLTADWGIETLPYTLDVLDLDTYANAIREAKGKDMFINQVWDTSYDGKRKAIDWQKEMTRAALKQQYGITLNGGNDKTVYNLSFGYNNTDGLVVNTNYKRFTTRANVNTKVNKYLEIGGDINYTHSESHGSNMSLGNNQNMSSLRDFASLTPTLDYLDGNAPGGNLVNVNLVNPDGTYGTGYQATANGWEGNTSIGANPYASQMENGDRARNGYDRIQTTGFIDLTLLDLKYHKLDVRSQATYTYSGNNSSDFTGGRQRFNYVPDGSGKTVLTEIPMQSDQTYAFSLNNSHSYSLGVQTYLTYNLNYDIHNLTVMLGNEVGKSWGQWVNSSSRDFPSVYNRSINLTMDLNSKGTGGAWDADVHTISYFARASYSLMDRYVLTGTIRKDGSSNFSKGNRWGTFPSVAGAWRISEEPFLKDVDFVDNLKLRVGWGQTGNAGGVAGAAVIAQNIDGAYNTYPANGISGAWGNRVRDIGFYMPLKDANLKWETTEMTNIGIDFAFLNNWDVTLDYFIKNTKDLLLYRQLRASAGYTQVYTNYGEIQNKGFEFAVGYHKQVNKDFSWNARLTGSTISNKVKKMGDPLYNTASGNGVYIDGSQVGAVDGNGHWDRHSICTEDEAVGSFYGYVFDGIIKDAADLADYQSKIKSDAESKCDTDHPLAIGDAKWKDISGPDGTPDGVIDNYDRKIIGNGFPKLNFGITVGATYKDWDFNLYMYGVFGQDILSYSAMKLSSMTQLDDQTVPNILKDAYNDAFRNGAGSLPRLTIGDYARNTRVSDLWVKNGDFLRIANLQVGYTLPRNIANMLTITKARVYLGISNLLTISGYNKYGDPEVGSGSVLYQGLDTGRYPQPRTFMGGVNITF